MITDISNFTDPQILICIIVLCALAIAAVAFIKTPASERFSSKEPIREPGVEYAPMYTKKERMASLYKNLLWFIPTYLFLQFWFFPEFTKYVENANCYNYGKFTGVHVVFYGILVFMPMAYALAIALFAGRRAFNVFKLGQFPLPNEKVLKLTKYKYGLVAKLYSLAILMFIILLVSLSTRGIHEAQELTKNIPPCAANKSLKDAP
jgi:hypothetical protein